MTYQDKTIQCSDCGRTFTFTAQEQEFYASKGYTNEPKRCPECRRSRKADPNGGSNPQPNFKLVQVQIGGQSLYTLVTNP